MDYSCIFVQQKPKKRKVNPKDYAAMINNNKTTPPLRAKTKFYAYPKEEWKEFRFPDQDKMSRRYAISNFGRYASFVEDLRTDGILLKPAGMEKYFRLVRGAFHHEVEVDGKLKRVKVEQKLALHRLVAETFIKNPENKPFIIHKDNDTHNNHVDNLSWATAEELKAHRQNDLRYQTYEEKRKMRGMKFTPATVKIIKKMAIEGKTRQKMIAKQFGISEMGVYRLKYGICWGHLDVD